MPNTYDKAKNFITELNKLLSSFDADIRVVHENISFHFGDLDEFEKNDNIFTKTDVYTPETECFHVTIIDTLEKE